MRDQPNKRNKEKTKQRIFNAAVEVFTAHNYEEVSTQMLAKKAGIAPSLIYSYYKNKEELFKTVLSEFNINSLELTTIAFEYKSTIAADLREYARQFIDRVLTDRTVVRNLLFLRNYKNNKELDDGNYHLRVMHLKERIDHFKYLKQVDLKVDPFTFAASFLHMIDGIVLAFSVYSDEDKNFLMEVINPLIDFLIIGIKPGCD